LKESDLKEDLMKEVRRHLKDSISFRHEDKMTHGIPDISVTRKRTIWLEAKLLKPHLLYRGVQDINMLKLSAYGDAWYVIYAYPKDPMTIICHPHVVHEAYRRKLDGRELWEHLTKDQAFVHGFDHMHVIEFIRRVTA